MLDRRFEVILSHRFPGVDGEWGPQFALLPELASKLWNSKSARSLVPLGDVGTFAISALSRSSKVRLEYAADVLPNQSALLKW